LAFNNSGTAQQEEDFFEWCGETPPFSRKTKSNKKKEGKNCTIDRLAILISIISDRVWLRDYQSNDYSGSIKNDYVSIGDLNSGAYWLSFSLRCWFFGRYVFGKLHLTIILAFRQLKIFHITIKSLTILNSTRVQ
jgi:hypothetical protein